MNTGTALIVAELIILGVIIALFGYLTRSVLKLPRSTDGSVSVRKQTLRAICLDLLRAALTYLAFLLISGTLSTLFMMGGMGIIQDQNIPPLPVYICCALLLPLSFHSIHRAAELYDKESQNAYPFREKRSYSFFSGARDLFGSEVLLRKLICSLIAVLTLLLILPWQAGYTAVVGAIHGSLTTDADTAKLTALCILAPVLTLMLFLAKTSAHKWWNICRTPELVKILEPKSHNIRLLLEILKITAIYAVTFPLLPAVIMMMVSTVLTFGIFTLWIWISIFALIFGLIILRLYTAYRRRSKYVKRLRRTAKENGYTLTHLRGMRLSVLLPHRHPDFTLEKGGVSYTCKLIGSTKRSRPMYISPDGTYTEKKTVSLLRMNLFHILTETSYSFDGENKLVILAPMSRKTYYNFGRTDTVPDDGDGGLLPAVTQMRAAAMGGGKARGRSVHGPGYISDVDRGVIKPFETGERVGGYKFFSGDDFLGAMRNSYLDR